MLHFKRKEGSDVLSELFGIDKDRYEEVCDLWDKVQKEIGDNIKGAFSKPSGEYEGEMGVMFDASVPLEIFFKHFNTQELQDIALVRLLVADISDRVEHVVKRSAMEMMKEMFEKGLSDDTDDDEDVDFEEII